MKKSRGRRARSTAPSGFMPLAVAAAAGKQNDGNDDQPKGAVVKQIAKTVIHNRSSIKSIGELWVAPLLSYYDEEGKR